MSHGLTRIEPSFHHRIWGTTELTPWFPNSEHAIGEAWFQADAHASLLAKFIFTSAKLSVQVHPDDDFARLHENSRGKTEMWHILEAQPGAAVALGFHETITRQQFEEALEQNKVEELLQWIPAKPGDTFFVPAGEVHAIGAGLTLCEIQQNSNITYRLYDYGRARELHLEKGLAVARFDQYNGKTELPLRCPHFAADLLTVSSGQMLNAEPGRERMWIVLDGEGTLNGHAYRKADVFRLDDDCSPVEIEPAHATKLLAAGA